VSEIRKTVMLVANAIFFFLNPTYCKLGSWGPIDDHQRPSVPTSPWDQEQPERTCLVGYTEFFPRENASLLLTARFGG
jgi:hypothetical protein